MSYGIIPLDDNEKPVVALWDDTTGTVIPVHIKSKVTGADGKTYALMDVNVGGSVSLATGSAPGQNSDNLIIIASAAQTANVNSADQTNANCKGINLYINTGAFGVGATGITATLQGKDPVTGQYYTIVQSAALVASTFLVLQVYPGLTAAANSIANAALPKTWRIILAATAWGTGGSVVGVSASVIA